MDWDLQYFKSGEYQVVEERLLDLDQSGIKYNPKNKDLFRALEVTPRSEVRVMIVGQDPYPEHKLATGLAFSVPKDADIPPTLGNIFREYCTDLKYPYPKSGDLTPWAKQGVLLWNAIPTCIAGKPGSHFGLLEWKPLTIEIINVLNPKGIVFVFLGAYAREFAKLVDTTVNEVIELAHPSPRNNINKFLKTPFLGSRIFSTINDKLNKVGEEPIDWRLE